MEPWQVIKGAVDGVEDIGQRQTIVQYFRAVGHNKLRPKKERLGYPRLDSEVRPKIIEIKKDLGIKAGIIPEGVSELLAVVALNNDNEVFFATQQ